VRGLFAGLFFALIIVVVAVVVAIVGALGVAGIGWLLHRWFDLTQWQGSLIALVVALGIGYVASRMASAPVYEPEWTALDEDDADVLEAVADEPPIVPWRQKRPTPGNLPFERSKPKGSRRK
jgi:hypothetical protein